MQSLTNQNATDLETKQQLRSNNRKLSVFVIAGVLLSAAVAGSLVYLWQKSASKEAITRLEQKVSSLEEQIVNTENSTMQSTAEATSSLSPTIEPTANWKTYNSENLGVTFRYPASIVMIKTGNADRLEPSVSFVTESKYSQVQEANIDKVPIALYVGDVDSERQDYYYGGYKWTEDIIHSLSVLSVDETKQGVKESITKKDDLIVDGLQATRYRALPSEGEEYSGVALIRGNNSYLFVFYPRKSDITEATFDQILATLKFI